MQTINLKQYYPFCKEDIFVEVSDEIVEAFLLDKRAEAARDRKMFRYKAFYSLDCNDGIENAAIGWAQPSPEDYLIEKEELAEYEELIRRLYEAISSLPPMQARRVHARYRRKRLDQAMDVLGDREGSYGGVTHKWLENGADMVVTDNSFETVKEDDVKKIAQVEGIEEYNLITIATVVNPVNFSRIEDSDMDQSTDVGGVNLRGNRIMEMDMDVSAGKISLIEGRMIEKDDRDVCVISKELAELNHLKTGNLLKFNDYHDKEHSTIYSAEIIGIYETKQERKSIMYGDSYRPENTIFTDMSFPEKPSGNEGNPFYQYAIFKVQNAGKYDQVKKSVQKANIDWSRYDLIDNNGNIKNMTENFGQMDQMSMGLLLIVSVSGLVILVLVFLFWIKNRTQEIGIMMSLGKCKFEIWVQFLWEAVMISIIGMLLSFAISPIIAETSASYLAKETQTLRLEQQEQENTGTYIDGYIAPDLKIQDVEVHITKEMVLMDIGMISGILIIAVLVAGITIMKKRPKQILSEMS